nr:PilW family protein [Solimonas marina]
MARDIRQAGLTGCGNAARIGNTLNNGTAKAAESGGTADWWADFDNALHGYDGDQTDPAVAVGSGSADRVDGTDSVQLIGASNTGWSIATDTPADYKFTLNESSADLEAGDIVIVCDPDHAAITQISAYTASSQTVEHNSPNAQAPGNCSQGLGFPTQCTATGNSYQFAANSQVSKLQSVDWYVGNNPVGTTSLYRMALTTSGGDATTVAQEMVREVTGMQIQYHVNGQTAFADASTLSTSDWAAVDAVRLSLKFSSTEQAGTDAAPLSRQLQYTVTLRNRI